MIKLTDGQFVGRRGLARGMSMDMGPSAALDLGGIVVVVTHRMALLKEVNQMLVLRAGKQQAFGPRDTVLAALNRAAQPAGGGAATQPPEKRQREKT